MIEWLTTNDGFLEQWAKNTGDIINNTAVINRIKNNFREPYLAGQNHYAEFSDIAKNVNGNLMQSTDEAINSLFREELYSFAIGEKNKKQALADFKIQVQRCVVP